MSFRLSGDFFDRDQISQFLAWPCLLRETVLFVLPGNSEAELPKEAASSTKPSCVGRLMLLLPLGGL